jgi:predicted glutamine amidotransferase
MCGIVGVVPKSFNGMIKQHEDSFFQMLYADALRGEDSTGVIGVENDTTFHIAKEAVSAEWFIHQLRFSKDIQIVNPTYHRGKVWVGHNRKKTVGTVSDETAHPFVVDDSFAMVHNGTLTTHQHLAKTAVDSEALAIVFKQALDKANNDSKKRVEEFEEVLGKVYGAYACVFYDQKRHNLHLLRNKERPLFTIDTENGLYFCSEPLMGAWILVRNNYKYETLKAELVPDHTLFTIDLDTNKITKELLVPKKSNTSPSTPMRSAPGTRTIHGKAPDTADKEAHFLSGTKEFNRFRKNWLGKRVSFWPDDFLEKNFPRSIDEDGETEVVIMGGHEEIKYAHTMMAEVDLAKAGIRFSEDIIDKKWTGLVEEINRTVTNVAQVWLKDCKPIVNSVPSKVTNITDAISFSAKESQEWREKLGKMYIEDLEAMYEEQKFTLENWQITAMNCEIAFRRNIRDPAHAAQIALARDHCVIDMHQKDGKFVYMNSEGKIYYESAIVVH